MCTHEVGTMQQVKEVAVSKYSLEQRLTRGSCSSSRACAGILSGCVSAASPAIAGSPVPDIYTTLASLLLHQPVTPALRAFLTLARLVWAMLAWLSRTVSPASCSISSSVSPFRFGGPAQPLQSCVCCWSHKRPGNTWQQRKRC